MQKSLTNFDRLKALFTCCGKGMTSDDVCTPKEKIRNKKGVPWWKRFRKTKVTPLCAIIGEKHMDIAKRSESELLEDLKNEGFLAKTGSGGLSYFVGLENDEESTKKARKPRLLPKIVKTLDSDDKHLISEIIRHDHIKMIKAKARKNKRKAVKAAERREVQKFEECVYGFGQKE